MVIIGKIDVFLYCYTLLQIVSNVINQMRIFRLYYIYQAVYNGKEKETTAAARAD